MCSPGTRPMSADTALPAAGEGRSWLLAGKEGDARRILHCQGHPHTPANATALQWRRSPPVRGGTRQQMGLDGDVHCPEKQVQFGVPRLRPAPAPHLLLHLERSGAIEGTGGGVAPSAAPEPLARLAPRASQAQGGG